ncbi:MAG: hypothetical protein ACYC9Y_10475 [Candidatus Methylomirabilia bacterium]
MNVRWLGAAAGDLDLVYEFIALDNPAAAEGEVLRVLHGARNWPDLLREK